MEVKKCNSLQEAREEIDKVDAKIVELIATRNAYIKQIAYFKNSIEEVKAPNRVANVISRAREQAISLDLSPNLINDLFVRISYPNTAKLLSNIEPISVKNKVNIP